MTHDPRTTAEILAADPDTIVLEACPPELATISLAGYVNCDPLTRPVVDALVAGDPLPDEFTILDTYADCGDPPSWWRCRDVCVAVADAMRLLGLPIRTTYTMLDNIPDPDTDHE
jgi:hypothetical protein